MTDAPTTSTEPRPDAAAPPLASVRVLDFTHILAGPFCTRLLADLGAEVLHVERRAEMDAAADPIADQADRAPNIHRNKKSIAIDLKHEEGRSIAARLAGVADVIVENFSAGVMGRLGLDYERLEALNPGLIYVSMSGYGHSGPRRDWTSMNMNLQAYTGLMMVTGSEGDLPTSISNSWNDFIGGLHACYGILQTLRERNTTGHGRNLDFGQFECSVATLGPLLMSSIVNGGAPSRLGNRSTSTAPQGVYPCSGIDEWCAISVQSDNEWQALTKVMGDPAWASAPEVRTTAGRLREHDQIDAHIADWTALLSKEDVEGKLKATGVPAERMRRVKDVVESSDSGHVFREVQNLAGRTELTATLPFLMQSSSTSAPKCPASLGQHTSAVLVDWLGMSDAEIERLSAARAVN